MNHEMWAAGRNEVTITVDGHDRRAYRRVMEGRIDADTDELRALLG